MKIMPAHYTEAKRGFSMIELLVVVAVILILARLLTPSLSKAKELALQVQCSNNLHQMGVAFQTYLADYRRFPATADGAMPYAGSNDWIRFRDNPGVWACLPRNDNHPTPGMRGCALGAYANPSGKPCQETVFWCSNFGGGCMFPYMMPNSIRYRSPTEFKNLSATILLVEEKQNNESQIPAVPSETTCPTPYSGNSHCGDGNATCGCNRAEIASRRHRGGSNVLFADGHMKWDTQAKITAEMQNERGCSQGGIPARESKIY